MTFRLNDNQKIHFLLSTVIITLVLFLLLSRLIKIPITHDESGQILYYAQLPLIDILNFNNPWPTNHILNSIAIKISSFIFGINTFSSRLPVFLTAILFLIYVYKFAVLAFKKNIYALLFTISIFVLNPYLFEFFTLARGYGMGVSFLLVNLYYLFLLGKKQNFKALLLFIISGFLMVLSNFSFLIVFCAVQLILLIQLVLSKNWKYILFVFLGILITASFSILPIIRMSETNQFVYWEGGNFIEKTVYSLWHTFKYDAPLNYLSLKNWIQLIFLIPIIEFIFSVLQFKKKRFFNISSWVLITTLVINFIQNKLLHTPFLENRTALLYLVLYSFIMFSLFHRIFVWNKKIFYFLSLPVLFFLLVHFKHSYNNKFAYEWRYDQNTIEILDFLNNEHKKNNKKIILNTHWIFHPSFNFYNETKNLSWLTLEAYHKEAQFEKQKEYYYTNKEELNEALKNNYEIIKTFEEERFLLKLKP